MNQERLRPVLSFFYDQPLSDEEFHAKLDSFPYPLDHRRVQLASLLLMIEEEFKDGLVSVRILELLEQIIELSVFRGGDAAGLRSVYGAAAVDVAVRGLDTRVDTVAEYMIILERCFGYGVVSTDLRDWERDLRNCLWGRPQEWAILRSRNLGNKTAHQLMNFLEYNFKNLRVWFAAATGDYQYAEEDDNVVGNFSGLDLAPFRLWLRIHLDKAAGETAPGVDYVLPILQEMLQFLLGSRRQLEELRKLEGNLAKLESKWAAAIEIASGSLPPVFHVASPDDFHLAREIYKRRGAVARLNFMAPLGEDLAEKFFQEAKSLGVHNLSCEAALGEVDHGHFVPRSSPFVPGWGSKRDPERHEADGWKAKKRA